MVTKGHYLCGEAFALSTSIAYLVTVELECGAIISLYRYLMLEFGILHCPSKVVYTFLRRAIEIEIEIEIGIAIVIEMK